jgi:hypothetical protein
MPKRATAMITSHLGVEAVKEGCSRGDGVKERYEVRVDRERGAALRKKMICSKCDVKSELSASSRPESRTAYRR